MQVELPPQQDNVHMMTFPELLVVHLNRDDAGRARQEISVTLRGMDFGVLGLDPQVHHRYDLVAIIEHFPNTTSSA